MKKQKENMLTENYRKCRDFLEESSNYQIIALGTFCVFVIIGFAFPIFFQGEIFEYMRQLLLQIEDYNSFEMVRFIFINNTGASFFAVVLGIFLGVFPVATAVVNGYLIGFVSRFAVNESGSLFVLWRLFPHGIFELPAIILSIGFGIKIGVEIWKRDSWNVLKRNLKESMRFFVFVIIPLLVIAAIIESVLILAVG